MKNIYKADAGGADINPGVTEDCATPGTDDNCG